MISALLVGEAYSKLRRMQKLLRCLALNFFAIAAISCAHHDKPADSVEADASEKDEKSSEPSELVTPNDEGTESSSEQSEVSKVVPPPSGLRDPDIFDLPDL